MEQRSPGTTPASIAIALLGLAVGTALWTTGPPLSEETWAPPFLRGYAIAWACYVFAAVIATRTKSLPRWLLVWIVIAAVGLRVISLTHVPLLSTDAYRYLWDGRVANAGINPFVYPPNAPELRAMRDANWEQISFKQVPTIYPPAAQLLFRGLARVRDTDIDAFRWTFALCDVGCVLLLIALLRRTERPPERVIWYAWCPLPITEMAAGAHVDALALLLFLAALAFIIRGEGQAGALPCAPTSRSARQGSWATGSGQECPSHRAGFGLLRQGFVALSDPALQSVSQNPVGQELASCQVPLGAKSGAPNAFGGLMRYTLQSGIALACAVMAKGYAVLTLPLLIRRGGWRLAASFAVGCALLLAPYAAAGDRLFDGLRAYVGRWETNASLFFIINELLTPVTEDHFDLTRKLTTAVVILIIAALTWRLRPDPESLLRACFLTFGAQLLLGAPTLPWYAVWVIPALCWWTVPALALFALTVSLQYYARWLYPGDVAAHYALLRAGYVLVYALLIGQVAWWAAGRRRSAPSRTP